MLKSGAMKTFGLVEKESLDALKQKYDALLNDKKGNFAVIVDAEGVSYNTVGDVAAVGQVLYTGDVEGSGDVVADATITLEDGTEVVTDVEGVILTITEVTPEGEEEVVEEGDLAQAPVPAQRAFSQEDAETFIDSKFSAQPNYITEDTFNTFKTELKEEIQKLFGEANKASSEAAIKADNLQKTFNEAPAVAKNSAKAFVEVTKSQNLAEKLSKSDNH